MPANVLNPPSMEKTIISVIVDPLICPPPVEPEALVPAVDVAELDTDPEGSATLPVKLVEHILLSMGLTHSAEFPTSTTHSQRSIALLLQLYDFGVGGTHSEPSQHAGARPAVCHVLA